MKVAHLFILLCVIAPVLDGQSNRSARKTAHIARSDQIHPTMILWNTGLVETITPASLEGRKTWRITHYPQDPVESNTNDYDLYDLDQTTFAPLRSVMNSESSHLELLFTEKEVTLRQTRRKETVTEQIPLAGRVEPEGPGLDVFVARLPLTVGYKKNYAIVDRWGGHGSTRAKTMTLSVSNRFRKNTALGSLEVYDVLIRPDDGSFQISEQVFARPPHFPVRVEYTREGKTYPASEVIAFVSAM
jgi:hypothetical protein